MNQWIIQSIKLANSHGYLDKLYQVYPIKRSGKRPLDKELWCQIEKYYSEKNWEKVIELLIESVKKKNGVFPYKESYVGFWKRDKSTISKNPGQVQRIGKILEEMTFDGILEACTRPKETNQQIGPMFRKWCNQSPSPLGLERMEISDFKKTSRDGFLDGSDAVLKQFAKDHLGYSINKGLDFVARINNIYVIGEAKWITDSGGNQDKSFEDAKAMVQDPNLKSNVVPVMILDGILYLERNDKIYTNLTENFKNYNIMSALVLKDFLHSLK